MLKSIFSIIFLLYSLTALGYQYTIEEYNSKININKNNIYNVEENLKVNFSTPRRGIYRIIPEKFNGRDIKVSDIKTNTETHIKNERNFTYIRLGESDKYITGIKNYLISFKYNLGWDNDNSKDEVYYNIVGNDWDTVIKKVNFSITLPKSFDTDKIYFTSGRRGATKDNIGVKYSIKGNTISGYTTKSLLPNESLTIAIPLEEGYFNTGFNKLFYFFKNFILFLIHPLIIGIVYLIYRKNRDTSPIIDTVEFYPPDNLTPTELGYYIDGRVDGKDLTSMIFYWGNKGYLNIEESGSEGLFKTKTFIITKLKDISTDKSFEKYLFDSLFSYSINNKVNISSLKNKFYKNIEKCISLFEIELIEKNKTLYSASSRKTAKKIQLFIPLTMVLTFLAIGFLGDNRIYVTLPLFIGCVISAQAITYFAQKSKKRSEYGNKILGRCLGFKRFLTVTEKDKLEMLLKENPSYFYDILPYTIVLGVSDLWADKFKDLVTTPPTWYHSNSMRNRFIYSSYISSLNHSISTLNNSMTSSPKSTSNFGGGRSSSSGGSSGGGAGGGGGGSW
ncbi:DUF2207 domain-containing protein [Fusobacterium sp.]|uniref:DUF2207 domain-containing protein n=1 Tax=Fusobacterium sp. TaxID=68766 RepID=UPI002610F882|nr:DUF2207 domain-containing protein [Fusobacterium sp.]